MPAATSDGFFGVRTIDDRAPELCVTQLVQIEAIRGPNGERVERDTAFIPGKTLAEIVEAALYREFLAV